MKKTMFFGIVLLLCISLLGGTVWAGLDLLGDVTYDLDDESTGASSEVVTTTDLGPVGLTFTWERTWLPSVSDSLKLKTVVGMFSLEVAKDLVATDAGEATLLLSKGMTEIEYVRLLDGVDSGALTVALSVAPLTFEYTFDLNTDAMGAIKVSFEKSF